MKKFCKKHDFKGVVHGEDGAYIFYAGNNLFLRAFGIKPPAVGSHEFELVRKTASMVSSFIISGNANHPCWEPITCESPLKCLNMANESFDVIELPEEERLKVWNELLSSVEGFQLC